MRHSLAARYSGRDRSQISLSFSRSSMKKLNQLAVLALAAAIVALALSPAQAQDPNSAQAQPAAGQAQPAQPQQKKEIKDPAEYNAYVAALGMSNPAQKAAAMEQFLQQYPNTVMKSEALEQVMGAYQQAGDVQKAMDAATRLVQADPNNVAALYLLAVVNRTNAQNGNAQAAPTARQNGEKGLQALQSFAKPDGMTPDAYDKAKQQMALGFNGAAGFGALQAGDYPNAQKYLGAAVNANPTDLSNVYPLALAYLQ